jgi:hypothetical protein
MTFGILAAHVSQYHRPLGTDLNGGFIHPICMPALHVSHNNMCASSFGSSHIMHFKHSNSSAVSLRNNMGTTVVVEGGGGATAGGGGATAGGGGATAG